MMMLLSSGITVTWAHKSMLNQQFNAAYQSLFTTTLLGFMFLMFQIMEYTYSSFSMNDGVYGSLFYICTGFHGFHVLIGSIMLAMTLKVRHAVVQSQN